MAQADSELILKECRGRLEMVRGVLVQLRETCLFNQYLEQAIKELDEILERVP